MERKVREAQEDELVSFFTNSIHFEYGNIAKSEEALAVNDEWVLDEEKMELIRLHKRVQARSA